MFNLRFSPTPMKFVYWRFSIQRPSIIKSNRKELKKRKKRYWIDAETSRRRWVISNQRLLFGTFFFLPLFPNTKRKFDSIYYCWQRSVNQQRLTAVNVAEVTRYHQLDPPRRAEVAFHHLLVTWFHSNARLYKWMCWNSPTLVWACENIGGSYLLNGRRWRRPRFILLCIKLYLDETITSDNGTSTYPIGFHSQIDQSQCAVDIEMIICQTTFR